MFNKKYFICDLIQYKGRLYETHSTSPFLLNRIKLKAYIALLLTAAL